MKQERKTQEAHSYMEKAAMLDRRAALTKTVGGLFALQGMGMSMAHAQPANWPSRSIRMVIPQAPGGGIDILGRLVAPRLTDVFNQPVVVENKPGASANIGAADIAKAAPDGYSILYGINQIVTFNPHIYPKLTYNPLTDLVPVTQTSTVGFILVVNNNLPVKSVKDLVEHAKKNPGKLNYGSWGAGSAHHIGMELFCGMGGVKITHVPYKQAPVTDLIGGNIDIQLEVPPSIRSFISEGKVRALAYTGATRHPDFPDLPTVAETLPGYELISWHGVWLPKGASPELVERFNTEFVRIVKTPEINKKMAEFAFTPTGTTSAEFAQIIARDNKKWGQVIRDRDIKMD
ncbi:Bug family tripartite tricarboxylate transporter substrate binding protein [Ottowia thiooxydans]|uniref:Bug family tripartite tricarboxylate transporter substrate binding protein n=1 Tax=Ottowia thiooxydans TaxID=219182 RepID=UPI000421EAFE|nr:tripartite tricarboxylate transporter substrate binding protein [Ottowia thiooxydans]